MLRDNDGPEPDSETDRKRLDSRRSLEYYVTEELRTSVSHDTPRFLETMFPVPDAVVDEVYASVSRFNRHYDMSKKNKTAGRRWAKAVMLHISIMLRSSKGRSRIPGVSMT